MHYSMSFHKCVDPTLTSQIKIQSISITPECFLMPLWNPSPPPTKSNNCYDIYHHILLILLILELHKNEVIQYVLFYILLLSLNRMLLRVSMLLCTSAIHSFFMAGLHSIAWLWHNLLINSHYVWYLHYFMFLSLWIKAPWTFIHKYSYRHVFSFCFSKYLGAKLLDHRVSVKPLPWLPLWLPQLP